MKQPGDLAALFLTLARRDMKAFQRLSADPDIEDATVGFHAQQAAEKVLKAVLSAKSIAFRRTHDLAELMDLLADNQMALPPNADTLDELNPYAAELRYGFVEPHGLDRTKTQKVLESLFSWAENQVKDL